MTRGAVLGEGVASRPHHGHMRVWIESLHNLQCPTCDARLVEQAGRVHPIRQLDRIYHSDPRTLTCPAGHQLPVDHHALYAYRNEHGHPQDAPIREVPRPR